MVGALDRLVSSYQYVVQVDVQPDHRHAGGAVAVLGGEKNYSRSERQQSSVKCGFVFSMRILCS